MYFIYIIYYIYYIYINYKDCRIYKYIYNNKYLYFVQVIRDNMKDFLIFLNFLKILNLAINKLRYLDLDI